MSDQTDEHTGEKQVEPEGTAELISAAVDAITAAPEGVIAVVAVLAFVLLSYEIFRKEARPIVLGTIVIFMLTGLGTGVLFYILKQGQPPKPRNYFTINAEVSDQLPPNYVGICSQQHPFSDRQFYVFSALSKASSAQPAETGEERQRSGSGYYADAREPDNCVDNQSVLYIHSDMTSSLGWSENQESGEVHVKVAGKNQLFRRSVSSRI